MRTLHPQAVQQRCRGRVQTCSISPILLLWQGMRARIALFCSRRMTVRPVHLISTLLTLLCSSPPQQGSLCEEREVVVREGGGAVPVQLLSCSVFAVVTLYLQAMELQAARVQNLADGAGYPTIYFTFLPIDGVA